MHYKYRKVTDTHTQPDPQVIHALPPRCMTGQFTRAEQCSPPAPARIEKYVLTGRLSPLSEVRLAPDSGIRKLERTRISEAARSHLTPRYATFLRNSNAIEDAGELQVSI
jgi:hypothetical protein